MKKLLTLFAILALLFTACDNKENNNDDIIGTWIGNYGSGNTGELTLSIAGDGNWILRFKDTTNSTPNSYEGSKWNRSGDSITFEYYTGSKLLASITGNKLILTISSNFTSGNLLPSSIELTKSGSAENVGSTSLKIKNESSKTLYDVLWSNVSFSDKFSDFNGTWTGTYLQNANHPAGEIEVELTESSWTFVFRDENNVIETSSGKLGKRTGNTQLIIDPFYTSNSYGLDTTIFYCGNISLSGNKLIINLTTTAAYTSSYYFPLLKRRETYELTKLGDAFKSGTNMTKSVETGSGYIFFKVDTTAYRTQSVLIIEKDKNEEFTFNDYTVVVNVTDAGVVKTLGEL